MLNRRQFFLSAAAFAPARKARMNPKERVDAVLRGRTPDRAPFTFWHHFNDESLPGVKHAAATLEFQRKFQLDIVKVMSDYPYPKGSGKNWYELNELKSPYPEQVKALELIRDGLAGQKYFIETIFNPWNVAAKLSSRDGVLRLMKEKPRSLLDALEAIAKSEANHARAALEAGAAGIFLAIDNAFKGILSQEEYKKFSEPFDRLVLDAAKGAPLNTLHLHGDTVYLDLFWKGWPAAIINYSAHGTGLSLAAARKRYSGILMGGLDHTAVVGAPDSKVRSMISTANAAAPKWICAPGCSVPDESRDSDLRKLSAVLRAS